MEMKVCKRCGKEYPIEYFHKNENCKGGRRNQCKYCVSNYNRKYKKRKAKEKERKDKEMMPTENVKTRICSRCKRELPLSAYNKGGSPDGTQWYCRECQSERYKQPVEENRTDDMQKREFMQSLTDYELIAELTHRGYRIKYEETVLRTFTL